MATETNPRIEINGSATTFPPKILNISEKLKISSPTTVVNGGGWTGGNPAVIFPVKRKGPTPSVVRKYARVIPIITIKAFLAKDKYLKNVENFLTSLIF